MAYQMAATAVTLNDLEGQSPLADVFKCNPSNICAAFYTISSDSVLARFLCISRASCIMGSWQINNSEPFLKTHDSINNIILSVYCCVGLSRHQRNVLQSSWHGHRSKDVVIFCGIMGHVPAHICFPLLSYYLSKLPLFLNRV